MTYKSELDWYALGAIAVTICALALGIDYWIGGPVLLVLFLCAWPQSYQIRTDGLLVRTALGRQLIPYAAIYSVGPVPEDPHAPSFWPTRLRIRYALASELLVAPAARAAFLADMAKRTPHLIRRGYRLVPAFA